MNRTTTAAIALTVLGVLQMAGDVFHVTPLRAVASATLASPAPKVFSAVRGLETYSTRFFLEWTDTSGAKREVQLTPQAYSRLRGPYNRRNVYGAVLAYGPVLVSDPRTAPMFRSVSRYALCGDAPLLRELGVDPATVAAGTLAVRLDPLPGTDIGQLPRLLEAECQ